MMARKMKNRQGNEEPVDKKPKLEPNIKIEGGGPRNGAPGVSGSDGPPLPSVQMFDTEVVYRRCGSLILFKTESVLKLIEKWLKLNFSIRNVVTDPQSHRRCEALKSPLISWGSLKLVLDGVIFDLALGDLLALYRPFQEDEESCSGEETSGPQHGVAMIGSSGTAFSINNGKVYLSVDDVKAMCQERDENMVDINLALAQAQVSHQDAYLKCDETLNTSKIWLGYIFLALPEESKSTSLLRHLEYRVKGVKEKRDSLIEEMEQTVNMINRQNITQQACMNPVTDKVINTSNNNTPTTTSVTSSSARKKTSTSSGGLPEPSEMKFGGLRRTYKECANSQCGRMYHFIVSCCSLEHVLELADYKIPYMYHKGKIFLEKCSAFEAIGKTSVIRCSNYRKVDKILMEYGLNPGDEFLQQEKFAPKRPRRRKLRHPENSKIGRNRRQHVSLAALSVLIEANFITGDHQGELQKSLVKFTASLEAETGPRCQFIHEDDLEVDDLEDVVQVMSEDEVEGVKSEGKVERDSLGKEERDTLPDEDNKSSSGVESEEEALLDTPPLSNTPSPEPAQVKEKKSSAPYVTMLDLEVPYKVLSDVLYLRKTAVFKLLQLKGSPRKMNELLDKLIQDSGFSLEKAFLYEGRLANFVSTQALRQVMINSAEIPSSHSKDLILSEIDRVESNVESLAVIKHLHLKTMGNIKYQTQDDVVYFDTLRVMQLACIQPVMLTNSPSKANAFVKKLLQDRGVNVSACFLRQRQSKYAFINLRSALILLQYASENENKEKAYRLKKELLIAASNKNILSLRSASGAQSQRIPHNVLKISPTLPDIKYKIKGGMMYLHRKTVYESIGLESIILGTKKGFLPINTIITELGFDFSQVYLSNQQEVFAYMCAPAVILLLEAMDPIMVMLPKRLDFLVHLCLAVEFSVCSTLGSRGSILVDNNKVNWITKDGRLYFERDTVLKLSKLLQLSEWTEHLVQASQQQDQHSVVKVQDMIAGKGLELDKDFIGKGGDPTAYIGFHAILSLFAQEGDYLRSRDAHSLVPRDTLSAISSYEPKLRHHTRMSHFRMCLVNRVLNDFLRSLQEQGAGLEMDTEQEESGLELDNLSDDEQAPHLHSQGDTPRGNAEGEEIGEQTPPPTDEEKGEGEETEREEVDVAAKTWIKKIRADLLSLTGGKIGGSIGDWELVSIEPVTHLSVRPGYGAARKLSFMQSDVAAILKYDLFISKDTCQLSINDHKIGKEMMDEMMVRSCQGGGLSLLYQLISLRPCFGSFGPEVVETVNQNLELGEPHNYPFTVDLNFIGTSSQGRTYAGTVRSLECSYLAKSRVADRCSACSALDTIVINRSLLSGEVGLNLANQDSDEESGQLKPTKPSHQSVWKLDTTDERGCSFLCPQVQTFNCSLPHAFDGSAQATTVVNHKVEISDTLKLKVTLCGKEVQREFSQFSSDHQLGPVLDKVAALRLCVGYPSRRLVKQARYILNNIGRMLPEMRKLFKHFKVDEGFIYRVGINEEIGTIRSINCTVESEDGSDICLACRGLQQPIEFQ